MMSDQAAELAQVVLAQHLVLACAESCTGGMVSAAITDLAGSSAWFDRGYITYSNAAKEQDLGVPTETLQQHGAVSEPTAQAMAVGALNASAADFAIATTGIAGPTGATPGKPVGTVCFGFAQRTEQGVVAHTYTEHFSGDRHAVREAATRYALAQARALLMASRVS